MPALTKTQLDHAKQRVVEARAKFVNARMEPLGDRPKVDDYTDQQKLAMIAAGTAMLKPFNNDQYCYLTDAFNYPGSPAQASQQAAYDAWSAQASAINAEANAIEAGLIDELVMSPDGVSALKRIADAFA